MSMINPNVEELVSADYRYRGILKVHFQVLMDSIVMNLKRLITIGAEAIPICQP